MKYTLDIEQIKKDMIKPNQFNHNSTQRLKLVPFKTEYKEAIYNFEAIVGEIIRLSMGKKVGTPIELQDILEKFTNQVETDEKEVLKDFIKKLYFKEDRTIEAFHPQVFAYTELTQEVKNEQKSVARFLYDVLIRGKNEQLFKTIYETESDLLVRLLVQSLPELATQSIAHNEYSVYVPEVIEIFSKDLGILLRDEKLFIRWFGKLMHYYYFIYTSQTILKLNQRMKTKDGIIPLYFLVGNEKGGAERASTKQGFKLLKKANENVFSNVMLSQFLNYNTYTKDAYILPEWYKNYVQEATEEDQQHLVQEIKRFIAFYKENLPMISWETLELKNTHLINSVEQAIEEAFEHIRFQFINGTRASAARKYENWFYRFTVENYSRSGGKLGSLLVIQEDLILFIIGLCIGDKEKERLNIIFEQLELRGLFFDDYSKDYIVDLLESRNLLEKKSDSGDAKYVRSIL